MDNVERVIRNCHLPPPKAKHLSCNNNSKRIPWGIYGCSSSKGCSASKEVERSWTDSNMYNLEHNHRCQTLAGSTFSSTNPEEEQNRTSASNGVFTSSVIEVFAASPPVKEETSGKQLEIMDQQARELPDDLIIYILLRQPDKHLVKLKLVSKAWYFMISNLCLPKISPPSPSAQVSGFIFFARRFQTDKVSLKFFENKNSIGSTFGSEMGFMEHTFLPSSIDQKARDFQDCCNGLFLLARSSVVPIQYSVFNPSTRECISLPINTNHKHSQICHASLAFDPSNSLSYKVVRFSRSTYDATVSSPPMLDIFWSDTGKWSSHYIPLDPRLCGFKLILRGIYLNGVLYILSIAKFVVCIDLKAANSQETCLNLKATALELPERDKIDDHGIIGIFRGCLYYSNCVESNMLFWVLDNGLRWVLKNNIDMLDIIEHPVLEGFLVKNYYLKRSRFKTYAFHPHCDEVLLGTPTFMLRYHLQTRRLELIYDDVEYSIIWGQHWVFPYTRCHAIINNVFLRHESE